MFWLMGGLECILERLLHISPHPDGVWRIYLFARDLNVLSLNEEDAIHLGVNVEQVKGSAPA